ncbi:YczE/YyaS/YitT family protein [Peptoniphilaceae bacterium SGI.131]
MRKDNFVKRICLLVVGLIICGSGIGLFLISNLGVDPVSVFQTGLSKVLNISYGNASALSNLIIIAVIFFVDRKYISIATLLAIFLIGYSADFSMRILGLFFKNLSLFVGILFCIIGTIVMSIGIALYIKADLGVGAVDAVSELITDKSNIEYQKVRICADVSFLLIGYFIGGSLGIGTVIVTFLTGPSVQRIRPVLDKIISF